MSSLKLYLKRRALFVYRRLVASLQTISGTGFLHGRTDARLLGDVITINRENLKRIDRWIPQGLIEHSVFQYGILSEHKRLLDLPVERELAHADLLGYFAMKLNEPPKYLELGVSIGKTFWQVMHSHPHIECWGFDIEEINPALQSQLRLESREEWSTPSGSPKKTPSSISRFTHEATGQVVVYICADIFDPAAWSRLEGGMFNLILSDALHNARALDYEWENMVSRHVFNPRETIIMWDDLDGEMREWFERRTPAIAEALSVSRNELGTAFVNGWLGRKEFPHRLGFALKNTALHYPQ